MINFGFVILNDNISKETTNNKDTCFTNITKSD